MPVLDSFERTESPLSAEGHWRALPWTSGKNPSGKYLSGDVDLDGWHAHDAPFLTPATESWSGENGAYWAAESFGDSGHGVAAVVDLASGPTVAGHTVSLWIDMQDPAQGRSGYEVQVRAVREKGDILREEIALRKWTNGVAGSLGLDRRESRQGSRIGVSDEGNQVTLWQGDKGDMEPIATVHDETYGGGYVAVEAYGRRTRMTNLRVGEPAFAPEVVLDVPQRDPLSRTELPLSLEGSWTPLAWDTVPNPLYGSGQVLPSGWMTFNGVKKPGQVNGAFWNAMSFDDAGNGDAVSLAGPYPDGDDWRKALWLNAPDPGSEKSGYELARTSEELVLSKWTKGARTVLATLPGPPPKLPETLVLADMGDTVSGWTRKPGLQAWTERLSAEDSAFAGGYAGFEAQGPVRNQTDFRAGPIPGSASGSE